MEIRGSIEHIIYRNSANGYTVLVVDADGEMVTASGNFPMLSEGESVLLTGEWRNTKYGMQLVADSVEIAPPAAEQDILRYLASGLIKGVGEATAANIVAMFGEDTLDVIEHRPQELAKVRGISAKKAAEIANSFGEIKSMQKAVMFLQRLGLTANMSVKIYEKYGALTEELIVKNPYRLIEDVDGIGFQTADQLAARLGVEADSDFRFRAGLVYVLKNNASSGSTCLPEELAARRLAPLLGRDAEEERFQDVVKELTVAGQIVRRTAGETAYLALASVYYPEKGIAARLNAIQQNYNAIPINVEEEIADYERVRGITLHEKQREAVLSAVNNGVAVVTGGPGTGKTTIINCILAVFRHRGLTVELVAPTGRAAKRLSETTGAEAKTIHRLLDLDFKDGKGYFTYNDSTKLDANAVIVDEVSMVDVYVMYSLLKAVRDGARIVLVGDKDQLPSVGAGNILADIIASSRFPVVSLTEIYRQGRESLIITNAHRINNGEMPVLANRGKDFFYAGAEGAEEIVRITEEMVTRRVPGFTGAAPQRIQVLCPMKKGACGSLNLNAKLQAVLNPPNKALPHYELDGMEFRTGDKVMQMSNNYQLEWKKDGEAGLGVFNGDIGFIRRINPGSGEMTVEFEDGRVSEYSATDVADLSLAYAISIHKSQGSEFDYVVLPLTSGHRALFTRNLLYTAVTRARKMVVVVGTREAVRRMVENDYTEKRYSLLQDFLQDKAI